MDKTIDDKLLILLQQCRNKDRESQRLLYRQFYSYGMSISLRYSKDNEEAVEILNDSFLKVFQNVNKFNPDRPFKPWLRRIIINTALDYYRRNLKHYYHYEIESAEMEISTSDVTSDISYQEIIKLVQDLTPAYRTVFNLYVIDGFSHEEISEQLGISIGTSKSNLFKARANLMAMLKKMDSDVYARRG